MAVLIADKGAKPKVEEAEKKLLSDSPICISALDAAKHSIRKTQFHDQRDVDRMMQQGAEVALEEMRTIADRHEIRWWRNEVAFEKAVLQMWENFRNSGDMGNVEITEKDSEEDVKVDGPHIEVAKKVVQIDGSYLEGARMGVEILRGVLSRRWEAEKPQFPKPPDVRREPIITPPPAKTLYSDRLEEAHKNEPPQPPSGERPAVKSGSPKWMAEREREEKAKKKDEEKSEEHAGGGMRQEE